MAGASPRDILRVLLCHAVSMVSVTSNFEEIMEQG